MSVHTLPRVLRVVYPATVFAAVLLSWSSAGHGTDSASIFPSPKKPEPSFFRTLASTDAAACKARDPLRLSLSKSCPDEEASSWTLLGNEDVHASKASEMNTGTTWLERSSSVN